MINKIVLFLAVFSYWQISYAMEKPSAQDNPLVVDVINKVAMAIATNKAPNSTATLVEYCEDLLSQIPQSIDVPYRNGSTLLEMAVVCDRVSIAELLKRYGANTKIINENPGKFLEIAAKKKDVELLDFILKNLTTETIVTNGAACIKTAITVDDIPSVEFLINLLLENGVDINQLRINGLKIVSYSGLYASPDMGVMLMLKLHDQLMRINASAMQTDAGKNARSLQKKIEHKRDMRTKKIVPFTGTSTSTTNSIPNERDLDPSQVTDKFNEIITETNKLIKNFTTNKTKLGEITFSTSEGDVTLSFSADDRGKDIALKFFNILTSDAYKFAITKKDHVTLIVTITAKNASAMATLKDTIIGGVGTYLDKQKQKILAENNTNIPDPAAFPHYDDQPNQPTSPRSRTKPAAKNQPASWNDSSGKLKDKNQPTNDKRNNGSGKNKGKNQPNKPSIVTTTAKKSPLTTIAKNTKVSPENKLPSPYSLTDHHKYIDLKNIPLVFGALEPNSPIKNLKIADEKIRTTHDFTDLLEAYWLVMCSSETMGVKTREIISHGILALDFMNINSGHIYITTIIDDLELIEISLRKKIIPEENHLYRILADNFDHYKDSSPERRIEELNALLYLIKSHEQEISQNQNAMVAVLYLLGEHYERLLECSDFDIASIDGETQTLFYEIKEFRNSFKHDLDNKRIKGQLTFMLPRKSPEEVRELFSQLMDYLQTTNEPLFVSNHE